MNKFKVGDKVVVIINNEFQTGIIKSLELPFEHVYVQLLSGTVARVHVDSVAIVTDGMVETEESNEPEKIKEITVSENQLIDILAEMSAELLKVDSSLALECTLFGGVLMSRLFGKK